MKEVTVSTTEHSRRPDHYQSYLVRLWREQSQPRWRASLRSVQSGEERHFAHLEQLFVFLFAQIADDDAHDGAYDASNHLQA